MKSEPPAASKRKNPAKKQPHEPKNFADATSAWINENVPPLGDLFNGHSVDLDDFTRWLSKKLGEYRFKQQTKAATPTVREEADALADFAVNLDRVSETLHSGLPPHSRAHLVGNAFKLGLDWNELTDRLRNDLITAKSLVKQVERKARDDGPAKRGRPGLPLRDGLLAEIITKLKPSVTQAKARRLIASQILEQCSVPAPRLSSDGNGTRSIKRAEKRGSQQVKKGA
jgi:hypothetical protein